MTKRPSPTDFEWKECHAAGEGKAMTHAWIEYQRRGNVVEIKANGREALRISIKYREEGPYLCVESRAGAETGETMGACRAAGEMAKNFRGILEAHNALGDKLHSARSFVLPPEERTQQLTQPTPDAAS